MRARARSPKSNTQAKRERLDDRIEGGKRPPAGAPGSELVVVSKASADPNRARHYLELLAATPAGAGILKASAEQLRILAQLFAGSKASADLLLAHPEWVSALHPDVLRFPRRSQGLLAEVNAWLPRSLSARDDDAALRNLRLFKQREMLRIAARDLARLSDATEITLEISNVADVCLDTVWRICRRQFTDRLGGPYQRDAEGRWHPTAFCALGLGKLGGQELNYSSDVDLLFVYSDEGRVFKETPPGAMPWKRGGEKAESVGLSNHQFFNRLAEACVAELTRVTSEGMLYRIDLRLRPEGDAGPLCRSLGSCENYYAAWGQTWERMMLIKARHICGDESLASEFLEMVQPFRYPRQVGEDVPLEISAMKERIEKEIARSGELERNVKLGRGGIRDIEFIVQSRQLLHAGRQPFLQGPQTLPCLAQLARYGLIGADEAVQLAAAYRFLRDLEHRLQMENNLQTHVIPADHPARRRLALQMGSRSVAEFDAALEAHKRHVRRVYDRLLKDQAPVPDLAFPRDFDAAATDWKGLLAAHGFRDPDAAFRMLKEFAQGPGYVHVSTRTVELARRLIPRLLALCPPRPAPRTSPGLIGISPKPGEGRSKPAKRPEFNLSNQSHPYLASPSPAEEGSRPGEILSDPDRVLTRLDSFISAYGTRSQLFEMWNSNPTIFELLVRLFDRSEFLAEMAIRSPDLVDSLVANRRLGQSKTAAEILQDLRHGLNDEDQFLWLRRYHEAELMRIGLRDILGLVDFEQILLELSGLADACLEYALDVVMRKRRFTRPPFAIIGLGKLGGRENDYGSDLDLLFVADPKTRDSSKLQRLAVEIMELMSRRTEQGIVFHTDARLRPDGEKGLLVNTLGAYEEYYRRRARLWEIQTLTRTRPVAGDRALGGRFQEMAANLTNFRAFSASGKRSEEREPPACFSANWKREIQRMRLRIQRERTPPGKDALAIKTGKGGLMDAEFIAQALCLEQGWQEANTLRALERGRDAGVLPSANKLIENYRQVRRLEGVLRRWSYEGETVLPDDPEPLYRVAIRCGFPTPEAFRAALAKWRQAIRQVYLKAFLKSSSVAGSPRKETRRRRWRR